MKSPQIMGWISQIVPALPRLNPATSGAAPTSGGSGTASSAQSPQPTSGTGGTPTGRGSGGGGGGD